MKLRQALTKKLQTYFPRGWNWRLLVIAPTVSILVGTLTWSGMLQFLEWMALDQLFCLRPLEPPDQRIVVVTIDDSDITHVGQWPIPDNVLANLLLKLREQKPRAIALDLYRDLPVNPGHTDLINVLKSTPQIIGVEKRFGRQVPPPPILARLDQVGFADLVEDDDGKVRRAWLSGSDDKGKIYLNLGAKAALEFLEVEGIAPETLSGTPEKVKLGRGIFTEMGANDGGYVNAQDNGYQVLLNFRGPDENFLSISLTRVLNGQLPKNFVRDRVVFVGATAESIHDTFLTPYDGNRIAHAGITPGVFIHANIASQMISAALDGRPLLQYIPDWAEAIWVFTWASIGVVVTWSALQTSWIGRYWFYGGATLGLLGTGAGLVGVSYLLFLGSWWIPLAAPLLGLTLSTTACIGLYSQQLQRLAFFDGLTQVANRRYFDLQLARQTQMKGHLSLILCDVDCFKLYNDTYGHQAGDVCLQQIAVTIRRAVRRWDVVARYGGEEFAVILPNTNLETAAQIASRVVHQVRDLKLPHVNSVVANHVTLSCGVVSVLIDEQQLMRAGWSPASLVAKADEGLYLSKKEGRDRFTVIA